MILVQWEIAICCSDVKLLIVQLVARLTKDIVETYRKCNPEFKYSEELNLKRYLTSPSIGVLNDDYDNVNSDLILAVNSVLLNFDTQRRFVCFLNETLNPYFPLIFFFCTLFLLCICRDCVELSLVEVSIWYLYWPLSCTYLILIFFGVCNARYQHTFWLELRSYIKFKLSSKIIWSPRSYLGYIGCIIEKLCLVSYSWVKLPKKGIGNKI